jgi:hypothetical protein
MFILQLLSKIIPFAAPLIEFFLNRKKTQEEKDVQGTAKKEITTLLEAKSQSEKDWDVVRNGEKK